MNIMKTIIASAALLAAAGSASATTYFADGFANVNNSGVFDAAGRDDPAAALGEADGVFYSLTLGGSIDLTFNGGATFQPDTAVSAFEVTFGVASAQPESVMIETVVAGVVTSVVGTITNEDAGAGTSLLITSAFDALRFTDTTSTGPSADGFDLDAVSVSAIPLPAGGLLLIGGLAGLGALRSRKNKA